MNAFHRLYQCNNAYRRAINASKNANARDYPNRNKMKWSPVHGNTLFCTIMSETAYRRFYMGKANRNGELVIGADVWATKVSELEDYMKKYVRKHPGANNQEIYQRLLGVFPQSRRNWNAGAKLILLKFKFRAHPETCSARLVNRTRLPQKAKENPELHHLTQPMFHCMTNHYRNTQRKAHTAYGMPWGGYGKTISFLPNEASKSSSIANKMLGYFSHKQTGVNEYVFIKGTKIAFQSNEYVSNHLQRMK